MKLSRNDLRVLDPVQPSVSKRVTINITSNPLSCDYFMCWMNQSGVAVINVNTSEPFGEVLNGRIDIVISPKPCRYPVDYQDLLWNETNLDCTGKTSV